MRRCARNSRAAPRSRPRSGIRAPSCRAFAGAVRRGDKRGVTGKKFKHVVNIGIGGSDLGPLLVCEALRHEWSGDITPHFVSNVDRHPARGPDANPGSGRNAADRLLEDLHHAGDAGECGCRPALDRGRAGGGLAGTARRRGVHQRLRHGRVRSGRRPPLHDVGLGGRALFGLVGRRPDGGTRGGER